MKNQMTQDTDKAGNGMQGRAATIFAFALVSTFVFYFLKNAIHHWGTSVGFIASSTILLSLVIWQACDPFADAAQWVGKKLRIPSSVRGATLDAIASSMPELFCGIFFVVVVLFGNNSSTDLLQETSQGFGSTVATCAGSSIYNMILIPAICAIVVSICRPEKPAIEFSDEVVRRDGAWVIGTQFGLLVFLFLPRLYWWMAVLAIAAYVFYIIHLYVDVRKYRRNFDESVEQGIDEEIGEVCFLFGAYSRNLNWQVALTVLTIATVVAAAACYFLVEITNETAETLNVPAFFVAVIMTAAASSIPDTFMSVGSAQRGDDSGAISNVFGSNIFDICIGMSIPLLVSCYANDWQPLVWIGSENAAKGVAGLRALLFVLTLIVMIILWRQKRVTRKMGFFFVLLYAVFVAYAVLGGLGIVNV